ncbi:MAG: M4 family metallopeptidase [Bacteroidia bacterium]|nr:M4 family metallopeptidase [Bacteroidia bacterium]
MKRIILLLYLCACSSCMFAQLEDHLSYAEGGYYEFIKDSEISPEGFFEKFAPELGLGKEDEMRIFRQNEDDLGNLHIMYQRFYKGIKVEGNTFALHTKNGIVFSANGKLTDKLSGSTLPKLSEQEARDFAIRSVNSELFAWESAEWEESLRIEEGSEASYFPQGELLILKDKVSDTYKLAWKFELVSLLPFEEWRVLIDGKTGDLLVKISDTFNCHPYQGSANTLYYGLQSLQMKDRFFAPGFHLEDCERKIETRVFEKNIGLRPVSNLEPKAWSNISKVWNHYGNWGNNDRIETSTQWIAQETWDYLDQTFNWQGLDGNGRRIRILTQLTHSGVPAPVNAFHKRKELILIGALSDGNGGHKPMTSFHHLSHEIFHGVVINTADLESKGEAGSIHEAYCDIFSAMVDRKLRGQFNWALCSDVANRARFIRNLEDPNASENPAMIGDDFYVPQNCIGFDRSNDNCWIHVNSTIIGRAFNLLAGSNRPNQNGVNVQGIGAEKAMNIAFRALRDGYLASDANFFDARSAWSSVARMIYGPCSTEEYAVKMAFAAVGIGTKNNLCVEISGSSVLLDCNASAQLGSFYANAPSGASVQWLLPSSWRYRITGSRGEGLSLLSVPRGIRSGNIGVRINYQGKMATDYFPFSLRPCLQQQRNGSPYIMALYPNPAQNFSVLRLGDELMGGEYSIFNLAGQKLIIKDNISQIEKLNLSELEPGIYLLKLRKGQLSYTQKLQIMR